LAEAGKRPIRLNEIAAGDVFRCESGALIRHMQKDLEKAYAAYDQYCLAFYGHHAGFLTFTRFIHNFLDLKTPDHNLSRSMEKVLFKGLV
ncbi:MAG: hypothetical protein DRP47_11855, partial [Candidatus Zixiibacteriota bacterium]